MTQAAHALQSGKGHKDENFPVASILIAPKHRGIVLAFYRFARTADDIADHATAVPDEKLRLLNDMEESLAGERLSAHEAVTLKHALHAHHLSPQHAFDLLEAFRRDVTKLRYDDWDDLVDYCRYSAMPVGRFVLDVHGEDRALWPLSDALCAALQVINHLQDCGKDYRDLNRVYLPQDMLVAAGVSVEALGGTSASPPLRGVISALARRTEQLLHESRPFAHRVKDLRLGLEISVIHRLAENLNRGLLRKDPLSERVHHRKSEALGLALAAATGFFLPARQKQSAKPAHGS
jgi:squalene synthase HpnC